MASINLNSVLQGALGGFQLAETIQQGQERKRKIEREDARQQSINQALTNLFAPQTPGRIAPSPGQLQQQAQDLSGTLTDTQATGGASAPATFGTPTVPQIATHGRGDRRQRALGRLLTLDPQLGATISQLIDRRDDREIERLRSVTERGVKEAAFVKRQDGLAAKRVALQSLGQAAVQRGESPDRVVGLIGLNEEQLDLELERMTVMGQDIKTLTTPVEPITDVGKINRAIEQGTVTPDQGQQMLSQALASKQGDGTPGASEVSRILSDGSTVQVRGDGRVVVTDPGGNEVTGRNRLNVLGTSRQDLLKLERTKTGERKAGTAAVTRSEKMITDLAAIKSEVRNIDRAISALDEGAETGPIMSRLPSIRTASIKLDNMQKALGLDVVNQSTFGALSKGELDLSLSKAIPTTLKPAALREWLLEKRDAQLKFSRYLEDAAIFLGQPGNTSADWLRIQRDLQKQRAGQGGGQGAGGGVPTGAQRSNILVMPDGRRFQANPDGSATPLGN